MSVRKPAAALVTTTATSTYLAPTAGRPHAVSTIARAGGTTGTETFAYDESGSTSKRSASATAGKTIEWDREGHEKSVTDLATGKTMEYLYDADGNRLIERNSADDSATLYLGSTEVTVKAGVRSTIRTYSVGDEAVATRDSGGLKLMATDTQGTPLISVNSSTLAFDKRRYTPFGEQIQAPSTWPSTRGFLGKTNDNVAGTAHLGAREYLPEDGRFLSVDPVMDPMDPQQMNGYAYANNSPVTSSDPTGLFTTAGDSAHMGPGAYMATDHFGHQTLTKFHGTPAGAVYGVRLGRPMKFGSWKDIAGSAASMVTGSADLIANEVQLRTPWSSDYNAYSTNFMIKHTGMDPNSVLWTFTDVATLLVTLGGSSAISLPSKVSASGKVSEALSAATEASAKTGLPRDARGRFVSGAGGESATATAGRSAHVNYAKTLGGGDYVFNRALPRSELRPDAVSYSRNIVRELKPDSPKAISRGWRQVNAYKAHLEEVTGQPWTAYVDVYKP